jgi:putative transposase
MSYQAVQQLSAEFPVRLICRTLAVSESGYYAWLKAKPSPRSRQDRCLLLEIKAIWGKFRGIYGAPRIWQELREQGWQISQKRVARLMRQAQLRGKTARKRRPITTQSDPSHAFAANLLNCQFDGQPRQRVWLSDITYIQSAEGWLYLAAVVDLASREIVGLAMADHMRTELCLTALDMAWQQQRPKRGLIHHSDRGSQYSSHDYQRKLRKYRMLPSMSRKANCWDNAPMESFWATLKRECAEQPFPSHLEARTAIFSYIMGFYNRTRRHSARNYQPPISRVA